MNELQEILIDSGKINFSPANEVEEILQNVRTICTTVKYSVPMDRDLGIGAILDEPVNSVRASYIQEVVRAVREYEPRAQVSRVEFTGNADGKICPHVFVKLLT